MCYLKVTGQILAERDSHKAIKSLMIPISKPTDTIKGPADCTSVVVQFLALTQLKLKVQELWLLEVVL
jgi:hypothetical protein